VLRSSDKPVMLVRIPASDADLEQKKLIKRILIPLDGSKAGEAAVHCTEVLARALGAELILIQVMEPIIAWAGFEGSVSYATPQDEESRKAAATAYLSSVSKTLTEHDINNSITVAFGSAADQIIDYAAANDIDLIAMSSHGRSGIGRWVFGSITAKVLRAGDTPVLVVRVTKD
jgi:nucleotide-binding universal stress UspA family protein